MNYLCPNSGLEWKEKTPDEMEIKIISNNVFSVEKLKLFDVWDFPKKNIKLFNNLNHLMNYYCRINDESGCKKSKKGLLKRSWDEYKSGRGIILC
jgi:hypothetical protein